MQSSNNMNLFILFLTSILCAFSYRFPMRSLLLRKTALAAKLTPNKGQSMDEYRRSVMKDIKVDVTDSKKFGGRELLELIRRKWGVAYDVQIRTNTPFGEGSANVYINMMWKYYGQRSFPMTERQYLEHLEAVARYIKAVGKVEEFKEKVEESRKRPNAYFGYAVGIPLNVHPSTVKEFFTGLSSEEYGYKYEQ